MNASPFVGTHIFPFSLAQEGFDTALVRLRDWSATNAIMLVAANRGEATYKRGQRWDAGHNNVVAPHQIKGGYYGTPHLNLYEGTAIKPIKSPESDVADIDAIALTLEAARPLGLKVYAMLFEALYVNEHDALYENIAMGLAVDVLDRPVMQGCYNNPHYRSFMRAMVEDHARHYDVDGLYIEFEGWGMQSPFYALSMPDDRLPICFCEHCLKAAQRQGWDGEKARRGFLELLGMRTDDLPGPASLDGPVVEALRVLLHYPEVLAWEGFWVRTRERMMRELYGVSKSVAPDKQVGWNVNSPVQSQLMARAGFDYRLTPEFSDWVKPNIHNAFAAGMFDDTVARLTRLLPGKDLQASIRMLMLAVFGYDEPLEADDLARARFGTESRFGGQFIKRETTRIVSAVDGRIPVYAGLDVEPPGDDGTGMQSSVTAALDAGAAGIIMGQFYHDWPKDSLQAVGDAIRAHAGAGGTR